MMFAKIYNKLSNLGLNDSLSEAERKKIILTNRLVLFALLTSISYILFYFFSGVLTVAKTQLPFLLFYSVILCVMNKKWHETAKFLFNASVTSQIFILSYLGWKQVNFHLFYIPAISIPLVVYDIKKPWPIIFFTLLSILALIILYSIPKPVFNFFPVDQNLLNTINTLIEITSILGVVIIFLSFNYLNTITEGKLNSQNILLQKQFEAIYNNSSDAYFLVDWKARKIVGANQRAVEMFEMTNEEEFYNYYGLDLHKIPLNQEELEVMGKTLAQTGKFEGQFQYLTKSGKTFWGAVNTNVVEIEGRLYQSSRISDISESKKFTNEIQSSLKEKETLLAEIHHRVKNNLAVISSLLTLQKEQIQDAEVQKVFDETNNRIYSMALIHNLLYENKSFSRIDFSDYLQRISKHIYESLSNPEKKIELMLNCEQLNLEIGKAVPCGLIVNEALSNCLKHAFNSKSSGKIAIGLKREGFYGKLSICDNGIGFIPGKDQKTSSIGLMLIESLCEQIEGKHAFCTNEEGGTSVIIEFPIS